MASPNAPSMIVGIGASAGGLEALRELVSPLEPGHGLTLVVVQHLDRKHPSILHELLEPITRYAVKPAMDGLPLTIDTIITCPGGHDVEILQNRIRLIPQKQRQVPLITIDNFFFSLARVQKTKCAGVLLSGSGQDGTAGMLAIRRSGGVCLVQDPELAQFGEMPLAAIHAGITDFVLPPGEIAHTLIRLVSNKSAWPAPPREEKRMLEEILALVSTQSRRDFHGYKKSTLARRVQRRMGLFAISTLEAYTTLLAQDADEVEALTRDLLIGVTSFFRDPEAYQQLQELVVPGLFENKGAEEPVRVWVAGCATGEEAYSVAMLLSEYRQQRGMVNPIQIFATDLDDASLDLARSGVYPQSATMEIPPTLFHNHFQHIGSGCLVRKELREFIVFAQHNLLSDPPFSRLDLIVCRNVFIYLEPEAQQKLLAMFRFVLRPEGVLFMGNSESLGQQGAGFEPISKHWRIFRNLKESLANQDLPMFTGHPLLRTMPGMADATSHQGIKRLCRQVLDRFGTAQVLITPLFEVLYMTGRTAPFLELPHGELRHDLFSLVKPVLRGPMRVVLERVKREQTPVALGGIRMAEGQAARIAVTPVDDPSGATLMLVSMEVEAAVTPYLPAVSAGEEFLLRQLEMELQATQDDLQRTIEQLRTANEEFKAVNEESIAMNEELQSANEELESSKEELQSLNEELASSNAALDSKLGELETVNTDLANLFSSTDIATLFLDREMRIKRYTPATSRLMSLIPTDVGRPLMDIAHHLVESDLLEDKEVVLRTRQTVDCEVRDREGRWYLRRTLPYLDGLGEVQGLVISFVDVSDLKKTQHALSDSLQRLEAQNELLEYANVLARDKEDRIIFWNRGAEALYGWNEREAMGELAHQLLQTTFPVPLEEIRSILRATGSWQGELHHHAKDGRLITVNSVWQLTRNHHGNDWNVVEVSSDISERKILEEQLRSAKREAELANHAKSDFLAMMSHEIRTPMNIIIGMGDLLKETDLSTDQVRQVDKIQSASNALMQLINEILDLSIIEAGKMSVRLEPMNLPRFMENVIGLMRVVAEEKGLTLTWQGGKEVPEWLMADGTRLRQVLINLLFNAVKFTEHGQVNLRAMVHGDAPGQIHLVVEDTGIGIQPEYIHRIFDPFTQVDTSMTRKYGGTGLGLTISKRLVELLGGRIWVESRSGSGSAFHMTIPMQTIPRPEPLLETPPFRTDRPDGALMPLRILLAEDSEDNQLLIQNYLRDTPHALTMASHGAEAVLLVQSDPFDLVFMDVQMPVMDGYTATRMIREWEKETDRPRIIIVALTAHAMEGEAERSQEAGCDIYLSKPIKKKRLLDVIQELGRVVMLNQLKKGLPSSPPDDNKNG